jgi:hypothetical protein
VGIVALALLACLSIDASNPLLPGVVRAGAGDSMYWLRPARLPTSEPAPAVRAPGPPPSAREPCLAPRRAVAVREPAPPAPSRARRSGAPVVARAAPADDEEH